MFEHLCEFPIILVTGPQRSGTTLCARAISHELGHQYIDEARFNIWNEEKALKIAEENIQPCVIQGPGLLERAHLFSHVVLVVRNHWEITKSLRKIKNILSRLTVEYPEAFLSDDPTYVLPAIMYSVFWNCTSRKIQNKIHVVTYEDLQESPLWVPKEERVNWRARQWKK